MPASGFSNASASKALCLTTLLASTLAMSSSSSSPSSSPSSSQRHSVLKLALAQLGALRAFELVNCLALLYGFRHVERMLGTRNFISFVTTSTVVSLALQLAVQLGTGIQPSPGPFAPVFSLLILYYAHVPAVPLVASAEPPSPWSVNQKMPVYAASMVLALAQGVNSLVPALCGLLAGVVCRPWIGTLVFPESVASLVSRGFDSWFRSSDARAPARAEPRARAADNLVPNWFGDAAPAAAANTPPAAAREVVVREGDVDALVGMGFTREQVVRALRDTSNDVNAAANQLLAGAME